MLKTLLYSSVIVFAFSLASCNKCAVCTTMNTDPDVEPHMLEEELCGRGKVHNDAVRQYEQAGWDCEEE